MANEGSTKPTYSELEAENLRVRGLLQRQWTSVKERLPEDDTDVLISVVSSGERYTWAGCVLDGEWFMSNNYNHVKGFVTHWQPFPEPATFPQSSSLVSQGAESADIGKLDSADKSGGEVPIGICQECHEEIGYWCMHQAWRDESGNQMFRHSINCTAPIENGSAETGGEKAALERRIVDLSLKVWEYGAYIGDWEPIQAQAWRAEADEIERELYAHISGLAKLRGVKHKQFPNFPRTSQNQTVSSGVEGAHEGTTADKSGSREPEKLNNAQKIHKLADEVWSIAQGIQGGGRLESISHELVALAESSLSSPPPEFRHSEICLWWHRRPCNRNCISNFRQSSSLSESGAGN